MSSGFGVLGIIQAVDVVASVGFLGPVGFAFERVLSFSCLVFCCCIHRGGLVIYGCCKGSPRTAAYVTFAHTIYPLNFMKSIICLLSILYDKRSLYMMVMGSDEGHMRTSLASRKDSDTAGMSLMSEKSAGCSLEAYHSPIQLLLLLLPSNWLGSLDLVDLDLSYSNMIISFRLYNIRSGKTWNAKGMEPNNLPASY